MMNKKTSIVIVVLVAVAFMGYFLFKDIGKKQEINENVLVVGTCADYKPFSSIDNDEIVGFDIDVVKEVSKRLGKKLVLKDMPFDALIPALQFGSVQILAAGLTPTEESKNNVFFTESYLSGDPLVIISLASTTPKINTIDDLTGKKVVVNQGYTADYYISSFEGTIIKRLENLTDLFLALNSGQVDALVSAYSSVQPFLAQQDSELFYVVPIADKKAQESYSLAVSKKYPELFSAVEKIINDMKKDGTIEKLKKVWSLDPSSLDSGSLNSGGSNQ